jgi:hypothetical protein
MATPSRLSKTGAYPFAKGAGKHGWLFYATVAFMLLFFAAGTVHELVPGLCHTDADGDEDCAFCFLVHVPWIAMLVLCVLFSIRDVFLTDTPGLRPCLWRVSTTSYSLRAPPAR